MKKLYMLLVGFLIMVITGCTSSNDEVVYGSNDYTSDYIGTLKYVPAGSFQRDADSLNISTVSAFRMSEYEITREQFEAVTGLDNPSTGFAYVINGPVQMVNWYHALVFCNMLSMREGLTPVYSIGSSTDPADWIMATNGIPLDDAIPANNAIWNAAIADWTATGYRLPTEMEWMWAAMGATSDRSNGYAGTGINTTGYTKGYAGSTEAGALIVNIGDYAWYGSNSGLRTNTVGEKLPNELGIYDMGGNVWEWCWDSYDDPYPTGELINYRGAGVIADDRVIRGGCYLQMDAFAAVNFRWFYSPEWGSTILGFRVVRK